MRARVNEQIGTATISHVTVHVLTEMPEDEMSEVSDKAEMTGRVRAKRRKS